MTKSNEDIFLELRRIVSSNYSKFKLTEFKEKISLDIVSKEFNEIRSFPRFELVKKKVDIEKFSRDLDKIIVLSPLSESEFEKNNNLFYPENMIRKYLNNYFYEEVNGSIYLYTEEEIPEALNNLDYKLVRLTKKGYSLRELQKRSGLGLEKDILSYYQNIEDKEILELIDNIKESN